ncbi:ribosomal protein S5 domain 2-type protein [Fennellomyces sp. T-0311]|nr:ribosomal protein S5 domain 2-type protein [Fennellomyces sp. T-0311]
MAEHTENRELQQEEFMALDAIYGPEVIKKDESSSDEYIVTINLDQDDENVKSPRILVVRFFLPPTYPSNDPPVYEVSSVYCGTHRVDSTMLNKIDEEFSVIFQPGEVVLFEWISWLRDFLETEIDKPDEDALCQQLELQKFENEPKEEVKDNALIESRTSSPSVVAPPIYTSPEPLVDRKSVFKAHVAEVHNADQVRAVVSKLLEDKKVAKATHNIMAYRIILPNGRLLQDNDDDGETAAGGRLLHMMEITDVQNVVVVVSRWFGGILLGADRFKDINNCARAALEDCGYIQPTNKGSKGKRKK